MEDETLGPVLVVEDDEDVRRLLARRLERMGHRVRTAPSGELGLRAASEERPGLLILDIQLPGMDGWEMLRQLRANPATASIPVLVVSIVDPDRAEDETRAEGYLVKPFRASRFDGVVREIVEAAGEVAADGVGDGTEEGER